MRSLNIIFIAPPAAGKGTQAAILKDKYGIAHISTGDLLRNEVNKKTSLGLQLKEQMEQGKLIDDEIVTNLLKLRLQDKDTLNGYILDGYPRNINQAKVLDELLKELNKEIDYVFYLDVQEELAVKRACGRLQCKNCGRIYNKYINESMPKQENICDDCNIPLTHRDDDNEVSFKNRFETFLESTKPLIEFYKNKNLLYIIDSSKDKEKASKEIEKVLNIRGE